MGSRFEEEVKCVSARWYESESELVKQGWWWWRRYAAGNTVIGFRSHGEEVLIITHRKTRRKEK
jgi:hypothetical protein